MSKVSIAVVQNRQHKKQFLTLPWEIYKGDKYWIPPLRQNQKELVGYAKHPFYDDAEGQTFIAIKDGVVCGRLLTLVNRGYNRQYNAKMGFFGFFESIDDQEVADGLFEAGREWLRDRGMTRIQGPCNPSLNYECGLLVEGFEDSPKFMMTYNPPYYGTLIESAGFEKAQDMYAFWGHVEMLKTLDKKLEFVYHEAIKRFDIKLRRVHHKKEFEKDVRMFLDIYNKSLVGTWGFVPMSPGEVDHTAKSLKMLIAPEITSVAEVDGKPVGAMFALLDYNPRIKEIDGRLFPFGFLKLLGRKRKIKTVRLLSTNVLPEYQRWGVGVVLLARLVPEIYEWGVEDAEFSWVLESNHLSRKSLERGGAKRTKTYRIYERDV
ncbi:MAG: hypothetical protein KDB27_01150 [Planctomycetales bacterium]|nr:hypothetical protein [Planctomycetales bacterium]